MNISNELKKEAIELATVKFGFVLEVSRNVLLIKRPIKRFMNPTSCYMTIEFGTNENGVGFHYGTYDMSLIESVEDFQCRTGDVNQLHKNAANFAKLIAQMNEHSFLTDFVVDDLSEQTDEEIKDIRSIIEKALSLHITK